MLRFKYLILLSLLLAPATVFAQDSASADANDSAYRRSNRGMFELTPTVAYNFGGTIQGDDSVLSDLDLEASDGAAYGLAFDIPLSRYVQLEFLASRQKTELRYDEGLFGGSTGVADFNVTYYQVGGLFQWGNGQIHPYVVGSLGVTNLDPQVPGAREENRFSGSIGAGVKIFFTDNIGLRLEARGFFTVLDSGNDNGYYYDDECGCDYQYSDTFDQGQASAGLIIAW
ncbi:MAG: outer membrane beta-barrel protein [Thermoanaerobaculia bacterium]